MVKTYQKFVNAVRLFIGLPPKYVDRVPPPPPPFPELAEKPAPAKRKPGRPKGTGKKRAAAK